MEDTDRIADMEREDTKTNLPSGWLLFFVGIILWGVYYCYAYSPQTTGWTQEGQYLESIRK